MAFKLLSWAPADGMAPFAWVNPNNLTPVNAAAAVESHFDSYSVPAGHRAVYIEHPIPSIDTSSPSAVTSFYADGMPASWETRAEWFEEFWGYTRSLSPRIDYIVLDHEGGAGFWHWSGGATNVRAIMDALKASRVMPPHLNDLDTVAVQTLADRDGVNALSIWTSRQYDQHAYDVVSSGICNSLAYKPSISNWGHFRFRDNSEIPLDTNGWELYSSPFARNSSAPVFYPEDTSTDLDRVTLPLAISEGRLLPWIAYPSYGPQGEAVFDVGTDVLNNDFGDRIEAVMVWNPAGIATLADNQRIVTRLGGLL